MAKFTNNEIEFHYEVRGEGRPLVFLHGLGGDMEQPKKLFNEINGVKFIFVDQRFHGKTKQADNSSVSFDEMTNDIVALMKHLGYKTFSVGGISMGAAVATNLTIRYPQLVEKLILIRIAWENRPMDEQVKEWYKVVSEYLKYNNRDAFIQTNTFETIKKVAPKTAETFMKLFEDPSSVKYYRKYQDIPNQQPFYEREDLKQIKAETLILSNHKDYIHKYEYGLTYQSLIHNVEFHEITSKEDSENKHREEVNDYVTKFINN